MRLGRSGDELLATVARGAGGVFFLKLLGMFLNILLSIYLARLLGVEAFGLYSFAFAIVTLLSVPGQFGLPALLVRETSRRLTNARGSSLGDVWRWAFWVAVLSTSFICFAAAAVSSFTASASGNTSLFYIAFLILVPLVLNALVAGALRGLGHVIIAQFGERIIRPAALLFLVFASALVLAGDITPTRVMAAHFFAATLATVFAVIFLQIKSGKAISKAELKRTGECYKHREWLGIAIPLAAVSSANIVNMKADIIVLGVLTGDSQVGIYRVATQCAVVIATGSTIASSVLAPVFARLYAQEDYANLGRVARFAAISMTVAASVALLPFMVCGEWLIGLAFGEAFSKANSAVFILGIGQIVNALVGAAGTLLNMTNSQKHVAMIVLFSMIINLILNFALVPLYGFNGAAIATSIAMIFSNLWFWLMARRALGINSSALGV